jgi:metal-responsive CopG/Arc/MetJ family transcriptional regulator
MVYTRTMSSIRRSVTLPTNIARRVDEIAKRERTSANRVIADLIESGLDSMEREKRLFFELADRLAESTDPAEQKRLKKDLARLTYGD